MSFSNISKYPAAVYGQIGYALTSVANEVKTNVTKIPTAIGNAFNALDKVKSNSGQFGKLLLLGSHSVELLQVSALKPAAAAFGIGAMVFDVLAAGETVDYAVSNVFKKAWKKESFFHAKNDPNNFMTQVAFGVTNLGEAALWARDKNLVNLGVNAAKIGGSMAVAAFAGYIVLTVNAANNLYAPKATATTAESEANRKSNILSLVWTVSEAALLAIQLTGFAPATSLVLAGRIVAKSAAIASFLYKN